MTTRARSRSSFRRGPRRKTSWFSAVFPPQTVAIGQNAGFDVLGLANIRLYADTTITRVVGSVSIRPNAINLRCDGALGLITMEKDAITAGSFPEPLDDDTNWMHWRHFNAQSADLNFGSNANPFDIDVKVGRKLPGERFGLVMCIQLDAAAAASALIDMGLRVLLKH